MRQPSRGAREREPGLDLGQVETHARPASRTRLARRVVMGVALLTACLQLGCPRAAETPETPPPLDASAAMHLAPAPKLPSEPLDAAPQVDAAAAPVRPLSDPSAIDRAVNAAIGEGKLPGCVVVIGTHDSVLFKRAYGLRSVEPTREPMDTATVFDLASLTKTVATASSLLVLEDRGLLSLDSPVSKYVREFSGKGKEAVTVRELLLHTSGLPAVTSHRDYTHGIADAMKRLGSLSLPVAPETRFRYSDVGYVVLGEVVARVSGKPLDVFAREAVFGPLGMTQTTYLPPADWLPRIAPTERRRDGTMIRGEVHDPISSLLGGVAGNAGVFSTADDMTRFAQAILGKGSLGGKRLMSEDALRKMLAVHDVPGGLRALGWDVHSPLSINRADLYSRHAIGHGGYTGTGLWIDPSRDLFVLFLSNRVHPDGKGAVNPLVAAIGNIAVRAVDDAVGKAVPPSDCDSPRTEVGIDALAADGFKRLAGKRVALVSNSGARTANGETTFAALKRALGSRLTLLFVPEHGFGVDAEGKIADSVYDGVPVKSLYGSRLSPDDDAFSRFDELLVDLPDVGARFFTYGATLHHVLKAASARGKPVTVLDRPNPYGGLMVDGPTEVPPRSFVQHHPLAMLHGMTLGELGLLIDADEHLGTDFEVVPVRGWRRGALFDETGLIWVAPSPNLPTFGAALAYQATALVEGTNVSVGRGTATPFEMVGAPWLKAEAAARALGGMALGGVEFESETVTPSAKPYAGQRIPTLKMKITDRAAYRPIRVGLAIATVLRAQNPKEWDTAKLDDMIGGRLAEAVREGASVAALEDVYRTDLASFTAKRAKYLIYGSCPRSWPVGNLAVEPARGLETASPSAAVPPPPPARP